jgi:hypothetical protein
MKKDSRTDLCLKRVTVELSGFVEPLLIVFAKGYQEPDDGINGKKRDKEPKWLVFLATDTRIYVSTIIKKYTKR